MRLEPALPTIAEAPFDLSRFARDVVFSGILAVEDDKAEMKERVMLARQCGYLSDEETAEWIAQHGLAAA